MKKFRKCKRIIVILGFLLLIILLIKMVITGMYNERSTETSSNEECAVYYLLNVDGMKGLGHSSFMLVDAKGNGTFYSYNGMQYSLAECLMGKAGVGKMKVFELDSEAVNSFLKNGDLIVSDASECDNFDRVLYKYISAKDYETIKKEVQCYITTGDEFERLYADVHESVGEEKLQAEVRLQEFCEQENTPKYQIYRHNCDTVARTCIEIVDENMEKYNESKERLIPSMNYKSMYSYLGKDWGAKKLGEDSVMETLLWYLF